MVTTPKRLLELLAADLMSTEVTKVPQTMSLCAAARMLWDAHVSGAPVVDDQGKCVGVLSATDFMHRTGYSRTEAFWAAYEDPGGIHSPWQLADQNRLPTDAVEKYMTKDPVMVRPETPITELARAMIDAHIHRVIVVNAFHQPIGIVSSIDILAALAYADAASLQAACLPQLWDFKRKGPPMKVTSAKNRSGQLRLCAKTAADLMTPNPLSINQNAAIKEAIAFLTDRGFSAAPVIDEGGRPVGVVSQSDILVHDRETVEYKTRVPEYYDRSELTTRSGEYLPEGFQVESVNDTRVRDIMTPVVFSVAPETAAWQVVEQMLAFNVHRLFVVDEAGILIGVISALDVLRHLGLP